MQIGVDSQRAVENKRVFVVDSDDVTSAGLQFMLADEMETHVFAASAEALVKSAKFPPDLILLGMAALESEGAKVVTQFTTALPDAKILVVCFDADEPLVKEALSLGAVGTVPRPLKLESVRRCVDGQLGRQVVAGL